MSRSPLAAALRNAAWRRRTPRIKRVVQDGTAELTVVFDRNMDGLKKWATFRTTDEVNGVLDWIEFEWADARTLVSASGTVDDPVYSGPRQAVYMEGNIRAQGRFRLDVGERTINVEDV